MRTLCALLARRFFATPPDVFRWDFSVEEQAAIDAVAGLCPSVGGRSVYTALKLQESYRTSTWNNDCSPVEERGAKHPEESKTAFSIAPNPAFSSFFLKLEAHLLREGQIELVGMDGRSKQLWKLPAHAVSITCSIEDFPPGLYFVRIRTDEKLLNQEKLSIVR